MNATKASQLTKPERRLLFSVVLVTLWCFLAAALLGSGSHQWTFGSSTPPNVAKSTRTFGLPPYLVIEQTDVDALGQPMTPNAQTTWSWHPFGIASIALMLSVAAIALRYSYFQFINRRLAPLHLCDECGYDMTGVPSKRCPECGAQNESGAV